ncbi:MAG: hypothetical protein WEC75_14565 [Dehalococcoidia bacterium]
MKHATDDALDALTGLLERLRRLDGLTERKRGVFYRRSQAFVHFHEDPAGLFADVRLSGSWRRMLVSSNAGQRALLAAIGAELSSSASGANPRKSARPPRR